MQRPLPKESKLSLHLFQYICSALYIYICGGGLAFEAEGALHDLSLATLCRASACMSPQIGPTWILYM